MSRRAALLIALIAALFLDAATASAEPTNSLSREVSGRFAGATFFDFFTNGCSFIHQTLDGTYETVAGGTGTFHLDVCPTFGTNGGVVDAGSFTLRDRRGASLFGTVTGTYDTANPSNIPFTFTLHVTGGTRAFHHVGGTISANGLWEFVANPSPISGTFVGSLGR